MALLGRKVAVVEEVETRGRPQCPRRASVALLKSAILPWSVRSLLRGAVNPIWEASPSWPDAVYVLHSVAAKVQRAESCHFCKCSASDADGLGCGSMSRFATAWSACSRSIPALHSRSLPSAQPYLYNGFKCIDSCTPRSQVQHFDRRQICKFLASDQSRITPGPPLHIRRWAVVR